MGESAIVERALGGNYEQNVSLMKQKLGRGDVRYSGSWWGDFFFYLRNNHILLSVCFTHPENPYTSKK